MTAVLPGLPHLDRRVLVVAIRTLSLRGARREGRATWSPGDYLFFPVACNHSLKKRAGNYSRPGMLCICLIRTKYLLYPIRYSQQVLCYSRMVGIHLYRQYQR